MGIYHSPFMNVNVYFWKCFQHYKYLLSFHYGNFTTIASAINDFIGVSTIFNCILNIVHRNNCISLLVTWITLGFEA